MELYSTIRDDVIKSSVSIGSVTYEYALENFIPLLNRFGEQRKIQSKKFYARLQKDIVSGCVMPAITVAFVNRKVAKLTSTEEILGYIQSHVSEGYILDGLQRLNTLLTASEKEGFDKTRQFPVNLIVAEKYDFLLYRMITLNNGQKPMTARHQIEMLTNGLFETGGVNLKIITEKETEKSNPRGAFKKSNIAEAYITFMSDNLHNQNSRIIETKLDEILVGKIMESRVFENECSFSDIMKLVEKMADNEVARDWLRLGNNLIGFTLGAKSSIKYLSTLEPVLFGTATQAFEKAFESLEQSKVNVGKVRREFSKEFIERIDEFSDGDPEALVDALYLLTL